MEIIGASKILFVSYRDYARINSAYFLQEFALLGIFTIIGDENGDDLTLQLN